MCLNAYALPGGVFDGLVQYRLHANGHFGHPEPERLARFLADARLTDPLHTVLGQADRTFPDAPGLPVPAWVEAGRIRDDEQARSLLG